MTLYDFGLSADDLPPNLAELRAEVRTFLKEELDSGGYRRTPAGWDRYDPDFSRKIGARGWIGMTWPRRYGGHERSALERYVVIEELLAAGAPVRAHWLADRQIGPLLLNYGSEEQKSQLLPSIAAGECYFCVGLSEADSGSDLASIRTKAVAVDGGWRITGSKIWTSHAHRATMMNLFARTSPFSKENRHAGVSQFVVDLHLPGITIRPIINIAGEHEFNEVIFDDVFLPTNTLIGTAGGGWAQVSSELAHERSGPERWLCSYGLLVHLIEALGKKPGPRESEALGRLIAQIWTLHRMSFSLSALLNKGEAPNVEAALVKDLGTTFDHDLPEVARLLVGNELRSALPQNSEFYPMLEFALYYAPSHTIKGGTREILRGIVAKGLGLR